MSAAVSNFLSLTEREIFFQRMESGAKAQAAVAATRLDQAARRADEIERRDFTETYS